MRVAPFIRAGIYLFAWTLALQPLFASSEIATDIAAFTKLAKQLRESDKADERTLRVTKLFSDKLPDYGEVERLDAAVAALLKASLPCTSDLRIVNSRKTAFRGKSAAEVFFILDRDSAMKHVVKAFRHPESNPGGLAAELSSMASIRERKLASVACATPIAAGKCRHKGTSYGLLLQSAASGARLDRYIVDIAAHHPGAPERQESLLKARHVFMRVGGCLAEFNGLDQSRRASLARDGSLRIKAEFARLLKPAVKAKVKGQIDLGRLKKMVDLQLSNCLNQGNFYHHGDAGLKNVFYDAESDKITLIDLARINKKISRSGKPLSHSLYDFFQMWNTLDETVGPI